MAFISTGIKGGKILNVEGFRYQKNRVTKEKIWWRCWRSSCGTMLSTEIFDVDQDNPEINVLTVSSLLCDVLSLVL
jgi:hypothetical protein